MKKLILATAAFCLLLASCKKDDPVTIDAGYDYFPVNIGHTLIYDVDSIVYDDFFVPTKIDTFRFQIKEVVESQFTDNTGKPAYRIERFRRTSDTLSWSIVNVWVAARTSTTAERVENNTRYLKLVFAAREGREWNGNTFNNMDEQLYEYTAVDAPYAIAGFSFDSTLTVLQNEELNIVQDEFEQEVYAKHIGLVRKDFRNLEKQPGIGIKSGLIYNWTLRAYTN